MAVLLALWHAWSAAADTLDGVWYLLVQLGLYEPYPMGAADEFAMYRAYDQGMRLGLSLLVAGGLRGLAALGVLLAAVTTGLRRRSLAVGLALLALLAHLASALVSAALAFLGGYEEVDLFVMSWEGLLGGLAYTLGSFYLPAQLLGLLLVLLWSLVVVVFVAVGSAPLPETD